MTPINLVQEKYRNLIIAIVLVIVLLFDFVFIMSAQIRNLGKLNKKTGQLSKDFKEAKRDIASRKDFEDKLTVLKKRQNDFGLTVTSEDQIPSIIENISRTAINNYVKIIQIKPLKEEKTAVLKSAASTYYQVPILIDARCSYHALGKFLNELESGSIFMKIMGLEITANKDDAFSHLVRMTIQIFVAGR